MTTIRSSRPGGAADAAAEVLSNSSTRDLAAFVRAMEDPATSVAVHAARVVEEVTAKDPRLATPQIARLVRLLHSNEDRVVRACANALPCIASVAPAKVARKLDALIAAYAGASDVARDGIVRTLAALCDASVAYQGRLIELIERALVEAEPGTLLDWAGLCLPVLKGEPHARAREVVELRLREVPRPIGRKLAELLGIRAPAAAR